MSLPAADGLRAGPPKSPNRFAISIPQVIRRGLSRACEASPIARRFCDGEQALHNVGCRHIAAAIAARFKWLRL